MLYDLRHADLRLRWLVTLLLATLGTSYLFGAWMVVLVAEATGVGYGLGQVIMLGRNTFNPSLVFFTIVLIGVLGFSCDWLMRLIQRKLL